MSAHQGVSSLECRNLGVGVLKGPRLATVDVRISAGRFTAILGPNGAGKSTLMSMLVGERAPQSGQVLLDGQALSAHAVEGLARRRSVMPQDCSVAFDFTAQEVVELGRYPHRHQPGTGEAQIPAQAMELTGVDHLAQRSINTLSGGERARTHLARALAQIWQPPADGAARWLLLDEPTAALDLAHQHHAMRLLRQWAGQQGAGVVAVIHDLNLALRYADDVLVLGGDAGVHHGAVQDVLQPALVRQVWGMQCDPVRSSDGALQYIFVADTALPA
ncbi:heme ABC transporter ATP-binding protein [Comamonas thiooxydans]|uniref:heme ABC transporter ATP-binding protein n=1 Tax=Comamonas thiooxydans TaxID=363952 RepID=UPI00050E8F7D|nr:heme ABC transporter ATP-binding protein [Comamonas thiooxydans]KGG86546.1 ABC transporter [Comamonas thiooxydans]KGG97647.1 ABC transporter [Comamonas thiooxydans]KGG98175.1 ABC transporter [Comamonas thiooxydans]KGH09194.1 ABC transporter [Comamonas thiooxydans]TZG12738.1 heme ABC transporter ATP-binding protein [Comamonas thiooxydans]